MNAQEVIESYVRDVAKCLPRKKRNDVAFELRSLLSDELSAKAQAAGRAPDKAMAMELLKGFGRPAVAAARYHERPALIDATDTHRFLIWAMAGLITLIVLAAQRPRGTVDVGGVLLQWLGVLVIAFGVIGWWRRRNPNAMGWTPSRGQDWMPRWLAAVALVATVVFPVFMYCAPQTFVRLAFFGAFAPECVQMTDAFAQSWQRVLTIATLALLAVIHGAELVMGGRREWTGWLSVVTNGLLGVMLLSHSAPMSAGGGETIRIFESPTSNGVAMPIFGSVGAFMVLCAFYELYRERSRITPAPMAARATLVREN